MAKSSPSIFSMTGFGRAQTQNTHVSIDFEIRSVNSRFLDLNFKLPRVYNSFESELRKLFSDSLHRGRVEVFVQRNLLSPEEGMLSLQEAVFDAHVQLYKLAAKRSGLKDFTEQALVDILNKRDVVLINECSDAVDQEKELLMEAAHLALTQMIAGRAKEGQHLYVDVQSRFASIEKLAKDIKAFAEKEPKTIKQKILDRLSDLSPELTIDPERIATEAAFQADRVDVTEELVRLESHVAQLEGLFSEAPHGKKLDFLLQECGREFNTIGSKTQDSEIKQRVLAAKAELEKLREQAMNLE